MSIKQKILTLLTLLFLATATAYSQSDLEIQRVFSQCGKQKGVIMVEMKNKQFGGIRFSLFRSLTTKANSDVEQFTRQCIEKDRINATKIKEVVVSGVVQTIFLELPKRGNTSRLILFNTTKKKSQSITLIYIESKAEAEDIINFILKKK